MHSVYLKASAPRSTLPEANLRKGDPAEQLFAVARVTRDWLSRIERHDPHREQVQRISILAEDLAARGTPSPPAIDAIRAMLCANCRRLDAAPSECSGQALERCPLLTGAIQLRADRGKALADPGGAMPMNSRHTRRGE